MRVQVGKTECDYAQHTEANHGKVVQALTDELRETAVQLSKLQGAEKRYERLVGELEAQHEEKVRSLTAELEQRDVRLVEAAESAERKLASAVAVKVRMIESRDEKLRELHAGAKEAALRLDDVRAEFVEERASLQAVCDERLSTIRSICGRLGGQPTVNRNDEELESMQGSSCTMSRTAMSRRIGDVLGVVGEESEISLQSLVDALIAGGYLPLLWETEEVWEMRMDWLEESRNELTLEWSAALAMRIRDKLTISYDKMDELRYMLSHHRVGKQLRPRTWKINPWTGARLFFRSRSVRVPAFSAGPGSWPSRNCATASPWTRRVGSRSEVLRPRSPFSTIATKPGGSSSRSTRIRRSSPCWAPMARASASAA